MRDSKVFRNTIFAVVLAILGIASYYVKHLYGEENPAKVNININEKEEGDVDVKVDVHEKDHIEHNYYYYYHNSNSIKTQKNTPSGDPQSVKPASPSVQVEPKTEPKFVKPTTPTVHVEPQREPVYPDVTPKPAPVVKVTPPHTPKEPVAVPKTHKPKEVEHRNVAVTHHSSPISSPKVEKPCDNCGTRSRIYTATFSQ